MKRFFNDKSLFSSAFFGVFLLVFVLLLSSRCVREIECVDENDDDGNDYETGSEKKTHEEEERILKDISDTRNEIAIHQKIIVLQIAFLKSLFDYFLILR